MNKNLILIFIKLNIILNTMKLNESDCFMWLKLIFFQCMGFIMLAVFCKGIIFLLQKYLLSKQYKLTSGFYYILSWSLIFILGIFFGKEYLFLIL